MCIQRSQDKREQITSLSQTTSNQNNLSVVESTMSGTCNAKIGSIRNGKNIQSHMLISPSKTIFQQISLFVHVQQKPATFKNRKGELFHSFSLNKSLFINFANNNYSRIHLIVEKILIL